jgi:hypothetical protein
MDFVSLANYMILNNQFSEGNFDFRNVVFCYMMPQNLRWTKYIHDENDYYISLADKFKQILDIPQRAKPQLLTYEYLRGNKGKWRAADSSNAILLIPDGKSLFRESKEELKEATITFFSKLAEELNKKGYKVYCNSDEYEIGGAEVLRLPLDELVLAAKEFKCAIASMTGLAELLILAQCNIIHVYPEEFAFGLKAVERYGKEAGNNNTRGFLWVKNEENQLVRDIVENMNFKSQGNNIDEK